jgi:hypothetical protein
MTRRFFELILWGGSIALPLFRLPGAFLILAGIARLRQNLPLAGRSVPPVWENSR